MVVAPATVARNRARHPEMGVFNTGTSSAICPCTECADSRLLRPLIAVHGPWKTITSDFSGGVLDGLLLGRTRTNPGQLRHQGPM